MMPKTTFIVLFLLSVASSACGRSTPSPSSVQPSLLPAATVTAGAPATQTYPAVVATLTVEPAELAPAGLEVVYLREGNLWSWTAASGNVVLTGTGDMAAARLSDDGQLLAFMRGKEAWTIRMDGTEARPLVIQEEEGGRLSFSPHGSFLAVSTKDHIDLIDLAAATTRTVLTYPALQDEYFPEVVWAMDSTGFKTIIPPASETGQSEFMFVPTGGTRASLAKFSMAPLEESEPFISPDGGYLIYVAELPDGEESLYVMDSSGATRPYGKPSSQVRALGWLPDSDHFAYAVEKQNRVMIGSVTEDTPVETQVKGFERIRWLDMERFLGLQEGEFYWGSIQGQKTLLAEGVTDFDFEK